MQLDTPTLTAVAGVISLGVCIGFTSLLLVLPGQPALRAWVASQWVGTFGIVLIALRGVIPDFISIVLANGIIAAANALLVLGIALHIRLALSWRPLAAAVLSYMALLAWFTYGHRDLNTRVQIASAASVMWDLWCAVLLLRANDRAIRRSCRIAAAVSLVDAGFFIYRLTMQVTPGIGDHLLQASALVSYTYVVGIIVSLATNFAMLLLITERLMVDLRLMARTDTLTGLLNRGAFLADGNRALERCRRQQQPLAVLVIDLDHFKQINDTYGHDAGDAVLRHASLAIRRHLRWSDGLVSRYGGEEFLVALPGADLSEAHVVAERLRQQLAAAPAIFEDQPIPVTGSIGVAASKQSDFDALIAQADDALYRAKSEGRNAVVVWEVV